MTFPLSGNCTLRLPLMLKSLFLLAAATVTAQPDVCAVPDALVTEFLEVYESAARMPDLVYGIANEKPDVVVRRAHRMMAVAEQIYDMRLGYDFGNGIVLPLRLFLVETEFALRAGGHVPGAPAPRPG